MAISAFDVRRATLEDSADKRDEINYTFKSAKELGHLTSMVSLKRLNVSFNDLSHVRSIQSLQQLQHINLSHNTVSSLDPISSLQCLTSLIAGCNKISSTAALAGLPALKVLALHGNAIDKPSAVLLLRSLTALQHLTLAKNPVCKQEDWQKATIGALSWLQALDSLVLTEADHKAARPHAADWHRAVEAGDLSYSSGGSTSSSWGGNNTGQSTGGVAQTPLSSRQLSGCIGAGRLALQQGSKDSSSISIKDAASLLPSISKRQLKPSSLTVRPNSEQGQQQHSGYGYSQAKPTRMMHQQRYEGSTSAAAAVSVRSDGSAAIQWPDSSMAATLDIDDITAAAYATGSGVGYRLLAMYRSVVGVAASFDGNGGFVQYPSGGLMLVWNKKDGVGTCYASDGSITHSFNSRKQPLSLKQDVSVQLDGHYSITFTKGCELKLFFNCQGCKIGLSVLHGALLPAAPAAKQSAEDASTSSNTAVALEPPAASGAVSAITASADTQALLARARALMATEPTVEPAVDSIGGQELIVAAAGTVRGSSSTMSMSSSAPAAAEKDELRDLMAHARALMAESHPDIM